MYSLTLDINRLVSQVYTKNEEKKPELPLTIGCKTMKTARQRIMWSTKNVFSTVVKFKNYH